MSCVTRKPAFRVFQPSPTQTVQPQDLKNSDLGSRVFLNYLCTENKGADQLHDYFVMRIETGTLRP